MTDKFSDIHNHLLWGLDDGPRQSAETLKMLKLAADDGIGTIYATPHITPGIEPFDQAAYDERITGVRRYCAESGNGIRVLSGAEIRYTSYTVSMLRDGRLPTLNDSFFVLIEFWSDVRWHDLVSSVDALYRAGYTPILAHVERYNCFLMMPGRAAALREDADVRFQVNCNTVSNPRGPFTKYLLRRLFNAGAVDYIATDAHNSTTRQSNMQKAYFAVSRRFGREYAERVTKFSI